MSVRKKIDSEFQGFYLKEERHRDDVIQKWREHESEPEEKWLRFALDHATDENNELFQKHVQERAKHLSQEECFEMIQSFVSLLEDELVDDLVERRAYDAIEKLLVIKALKQALKGKG